MRSTTSPIYFVDRGSALFSGERGYGARRLPSVSRGTIAVPVGRATNRVCASETEFLSSVVVTIAARKSSSVLISVPGYYTSFAQATGDALKLQAGGLCAGPPKPKPVVSAPVVLYVSNRDVALRQSHQLHGHQRAGQAGNELILCSGVDTIDVSYFKSSDRVGHSYQVDTKIANDAREAFAGTPPSKRGLTAVDRGGSVYDELR